MLLNLTYKWYLKIMNILLNEKDLITFEEEVVDNFNSAKLKLLFIYIMEMKAVNKNI